MPECNVVGFPPIATLDRDTGIPVTALEGAEDTSATQLVGFFELLSVYPSNAPCPSLGLRRRPAERICIHGGGFLQEAVLCLGRAWGAELFYMYISTGSNYGYCGGRLPTVCSLRRTATSSQWSARAR